MRPIWASSAPDISTKLVFWLYYVVISNLVANQPQKIWKVWKKPHFCSNRVCQKSQNSNKCILKPEIKKLCWGFNWYHQDTSQQVFQASRQFKKFPVSHIFLLRPLWSIYCFCSSRFMQNLEFIPLVHLFYHVWTHW